jgi:CDP-diacylglycerol---glycerol-3-phosphate 3-phosphatidyltransferase
MKWFLKLNLPNKLTVIRMDVVLIIILIAAIPNSWINLDQNLFTIFNQNYSIERVVIFGLFLIGALTDYFDGVIARKYNLITTFGKFLDPIADKLLVNTLFIILAWQQEVSVLIPIIFIVRDTVVDAVRLIAIDKKVVIAASNLGKLKTVSQMVALVFVLLYLPLAQYVVFFAALTSLVSGFDYFNKSKDMVLEGTK